MILFDSKRWRVQSALARDCKGGSTFGLGASFWRNGGIDVQGWRFSAWAIELQLLAWRVVVSRVNPLDVHGAEVCHSDPSAPSPG